MVLPELLGFDAHRLAEPGRRLDYLGPDGAMFTGTHTINGRTYVFDENGAWVG